jgi:hypothetical protein
MGNQWLQILGRFPNIKTRSKGDPETQTVQWKPQPQQTFAFSNSTSNDGVVEFAGIIKFI